MVHHFYQLYGLRIRSVLPLPEMVEATAGPFDVDIQTVDRLPDGVTPLIIDPVAHFGVIAGRRIFVVRGDEAEDVNLRLFLLGSAMGLLLHQRGDIPLHANSLRLGDASVIVMGASGAGKSSLAAWMQRHGVTPLSDDVCVVRFDVNGFARSFPGLPRLRLWEDALVREGVSVEGLSLAYQSGSSSRKYHLPLACEPDDRPAPRLAAAYVLDTGDKFRIDELSGLDAVEAYFAHTYRGHYVQSDGSPTSHWQACVNLASTVPLFRLVRTMNVDAIDGENGRIQAHFHQMCRSTQL